MDNTKHAELIHACEEGRAKIARFRLMCRWVLIIFVGGFALSFFLALLSVERYPELVFTGSQASAWLLVLIGGGWFLQNFPIVMCPACPGHSHAAEHWVCGSCHRLNKLPLLPKRRTFLEPCRFCNQRSHSLTCRECRADIPLDAQYTPECTTAWIEGFPPEPEEEAKPDEVRPPRHISEDLH
jgi:hypothetical protein